MSQHHPFDEARMGRAKFHNHARGADEQDPPESVLSGGLHLRPNELSQARMDNLHMHAAELILSKRGRP